VAGGGTGTGGKDGNTGGAVGGGGTGEGIDEGTVGGVGGTGIDADAGSESSAGGDSGGTEGGGGTDPTEGGANSGGDTGGGTDLNDNTGGQDGGGGSGGGVVLDRNIGSGIVEEGTKTGDGIKPGPKPDLGGRRSRRQDAGEKNPPSRPDGQTGGCRFGDGDVTAPANEFKFHGSECDIKQPEDAFGLSSKMLTTASLVQGSNDTPFYTILDDALGVCYQFKPESKLQVKTIGANAIHKVALRTIVANDDFMGDTEYEGTAITIHGEGDLAKVGGKTVFIPPGYTASIAIRQTEIERLGFPYFDKSHYVQTGERLYCVEGGVPKDLCEFERMYIFMANECSCRNIYMSDYVINKEMVEKELEGIGICSTATDWKCVYAKQGYARGNLDEIVRRPLLHYTGNNKCMETPCKETKYEVRLTGLMPVTESYKETIQNDLDNLATDPQLANATLAASVGRVSSISIFYDDLKVLRYTQSPSFSAYSLVAGIGGYLGLFLGISLVAMAEILELLFVFVFGLHRKQFVIREHEEDENKRV
jgi:hypothetical protein